MPGALKASCKDCGSVTRKVTSPGPRCATCHRAVKTARKEAAWARGIKERYGITPEQYWALYRQQGDCCYICVRATGKTKRLAVDHDHATGFVRGLLCGPCNKWLGHMRDDPNMAIRVITYLDHPPAFDLIGKVKADGADQR